MCRLKMEEFINIILLPKLTLEIQPLDSNQHESCWLQPPCQKYKAAWKGTLSGIVENSGLRDSMLCTLVGIGITLEETISYLADIPGYPSPTSTTVFLLLLHFLNLFSSSCPPSHHFDNFVGMYSIISKYSILCFLFAAILASSLN